MKKITNILLIAILAVSISSCKKDSTSNNNNSGDLTTGIVGHYTKASDNTDIIVNRLSNNSVSIAYSTGTGSGHYEESFNATMTSATAFTFSKSRAAFMYCSGGTEIVSGTGTYSSGNISINIGWDVDESIFGCYDGSDIVTGSK